MKMSERRPDTRARPTHEFVTFSFHTDAVYQSRSRYRCQCGPVWFSDIAPGVCAVHTVAVTTEF